jgi:hypothetical protein
MLDNILKILSSQLGGDLQSKAGVKPEQLGGIMDVVKNAAGSTLGKQLTSGDGLSTMMNLFSSKPNNAAANGLQGMLNNDIVAGLIKKLGLDEAKANQIAGMVVPTLVGLITKKNNETPDDDPSPLMDLLGGGGGGLGGMLGKIGGLFK